MKFIKYCSENADDKLWNDFIYEAKPFMTKNEK